MESAGLNRILALGSPASSPGGASATMRNEMSPIQEGIGEGVQSALALRRQNAEIKLMYSQEGLLNEQQQATLEKGLLDHRTRENMDVVQTKLEAEIREVNARTEVTTAKGIIENINADMSTMLGPVLLGIQKMLPTGSAGAVGLGAVIRSIGKRGRLKGGPRAKTVPKSELKPRG